jgi:cytochrome P450
MRPDVNAPFVPPAPEVYARDLPAWRLLWNVSRSNLAIWPDYAFDVLVARNRFMGLIDTILLNDPEAARQVLGPNAAKYRRSSAVRRVARPLGGDGLFLAEGNAWRRQRRLLAPTFTPASTGLLLPHFAAAGLHLLHAVEATPRVNLSRALQDTALEAVLRALFSMPDNAARDRLSRLVRDYIEGPGRPNLLDGFATTDNAFAFANGRRDRFQRAWFTAIDDIIAERRAAPSRADHRDLLDLMLDLKDAETGDGLAATEIRDQSATMIFAGSETTARLMFWAAYLLTQDLDEQARVRTEIDAFPAERVAGIDDLHHWPRLRNVLLEALRLYPPIAHLVRDAVAADMIGDEAIAAGTQVWISPWIMHRHRKFWAHPTAFMPDRFVGKAAPWTQMPGYIPFGAGPRICIGLAFALAEAQVVLATLLGRYRVGLPSGTPVLPIGRATIEPSHEPMFELAVP